MGRSDPWRIVDLEKRKKNGCEEKKKRKKICKGTPMAEARVPFNRVRNKKKSHPRQV